MSLFDAIGGLGAIYGFNKGIKDVQGIGEQALTRAQTGATNLEAQTQFKPFTVTSGVGGASFDKSGGLGLKMTPEQQAIQSQLQSFGTNQFGYLNDPAQREQEQGELIRMLQYGDTNTQQASQLNQFGSSMFDYLGDPAAREDEQTAIMNMLANGNVAGREADIMSRLQASVAPEQERARLQLEQRLANQGRLGVQTSMFGGTPEALALEKAIAEQQAGFGVSAMEQARAEQGQESAQRLAALQEFRNRSQLAGTLGLDAMGEARAGQAQKSGQALAGLTEMRNRAQLSGQLGLDALTSSYAPLQSLLSTLSPALQAADIAGAGQRQGAQLGATMLQSGQSTQLGAEIAAANLQQQQIQAIANLLGGQQANSVTGQTAQTGLFESLFNKGKEMLTGGVTAPLNDAANTQAALDYYLGNP